MHIPKTGNPKLAMSISFQNRNKELIISIIQILFSSYKFSLSHVPFPLDIIVSYLEICPLYFLVISIQFPVVSSTQLHLFLFYWVPKSALEDIHGHFRTSSFEFTLNGHLWLIRWKMLKIISSEVALISNLHLHSKLQISLEILQC